MDKAFLTRQHDATQATTAFLVTGLTDNFLRRSLDVLEEDYDLFMQIAILLCSEPLKRSQVQKIIHNVIRQKEIVLAHCEDLNKERATLRKDVRKVFPKKPVMNGVKVYTKQTGKLHPVNGRLYQQLYGPSSLTTLNSTPGGALHLQGPTDDAEDDKMDIDDTDTTEGDTEEDEGDEEEDDDDSDDADEKDGGDEEDEGDEEDDYDDDEDEEYEGDSEEDDEEEDEDDEDDEDSEEDDDDDDEEIEEDDDDDDEEIEDDMD